MSGPFRADCPPDVPWVQVVNVRGGEAFAVQCARCKSADFFYTVALRKHPTAIAESVDIHALCVEAP